MPSAPRSVISNVNETSLVLEWSEPKDLGGRDDLLYNVICKKCVTEHGACTRCDDNVDVSPRHLGLTERRVAIRNLQAHTQYSFEIQAVNGVSNKSPHPPQYTSVNITTNQAGERASVCVCFLLYLSLPVCLSHSLSVICFFFLSLCLYISLSLSDCQFVRLSLWLSVSSCLCLCLSICLFLPAYLFESLSLLSLSISLFLCVCTSVAEFLTLPVSLITVNSMMSEQQLN